MAEISLKMAPEEKLKQVTVGDLIGARPVLQEMGKMKDLPVKLKYWVSKLIRIANQEAETFEDVRVSLVQKYGEWDEEKQDTEVPNEKLPEFRKDIRLVAAEPYNGSIQKFPFEEITNYLDAAQIAAVWFMVDEPTE